MSIPMVHPAHAKKIEKKKPEAFCAGTDES